MRDFAERDRLGEAGRLFHEQAQRLDMSNPMRGVLVGFRNVALAAYAGIMGGNGDVNVAMACLNDLADRCEPYPETEASLIRSDDECVQAAYDASYTLFDHATGLRAHGLPSCVFGVASRADSLVRFASEIHREEFVAAVDEYLKAIGHETEGDDDMVDQNERDRMLDVNSLICEQMERLEDRSPMRGVLEGFREITFAAYSGMAPREVYMDGARAAILELAGGHDVPHDWDRCREPSSDEFVQAAYDLSYELWRRASDLFGDGHMPRSSYAVISAVDNLVRFASETHREEFARAVDEYLDGMPPERHALTDGCGICERVTVEEVAAQRPSECIGGEIRRIAFHMPPGELPWKAAGNPDELPVRVVISPPATVAFWSDGSKTVAKCAEGDEFSEYTGVCICIAKRHVPRRRKRTFDDAIRKALGRAERVEPKRGHRPKGDER